MTKETHPVSSPPDVNTSWTLNLPATLKEESVTIKAESTMKSTRGANYSSVLASAVLALVAVMLMAIVFRKMYCSRPGLDKGDMSDGLDLEKGDLHRGEFDIWGMLRVVTMFHKIVPSRVNSSDHINSSLIYYRSIEDTKGHRNQDCPVVMFPPQDRQLDSVTIYMLL